MEALGTTQLALAALFFLLGGYVKGAVGFALPLIAVTGAASVLPAQIAVAAVIIPVTVSNVWQALRQGAGPLLQTARRFWLLNLVLMIVLWFSAGLLPQLDERAFFLILGGLTSSFTIIQLIGWRPRVRPELEKPVGVLTGAFAGFFGGLSGIWGPPTVLYLLALGQDKRDQIRATGLIFLCGSLVMAPAHLATGVLNADRAVLSLTMLVPAMFGMWLGQRTQDRLDAEVFRRWTLIVLALAGLNLLRRALL